MLHLAVVWRLSGHRLILLLFESPPSHRCRANTCGSGNRDLSEAKSWRISLCEYRMQLQFLYFERSIKWLKKSRWLVAIMYLRSKSASTF